MNREMTLTDNEIKLLKQFICECQENELTDCIYILPYNIQDNEEKIDVILVTVPISVVGGDKVISLKTMKICTTDENNINTLIEKNNNNENKERLLFYRDYSFNYDVNAFNLKKVHISRFLSGGIILFDETLDYKKRKENAQPILFKFDDINSISNIDEVLMNNSKQKIK